ncbi:microtubule-associated protein 6 homolog isoform X2 [Xenopus laevis]|uniref:Microtubule-associated protein 6 homolog isoform X2 n=1 Tax=Xenopus laevis TaxID=8355 RepID=A0A8J1MCE8_XENLA|nr:microtubule-associated protein 6 homolog isoform X2 [Xenopus laevis]
MAWPCVTRACCIARFGNLQDKGDIAVPLMYSKYSEVTDGAQPRPGSAAIETQPSLSDPYSGSLGKLSRDISKKPDSARGSVMRQDYKAWKTNPEPSCKPRIEYQPSEAPLERETQYKKDFRSWPIPRQGDHPWIPKLSPSPTMPIISSEDKKKNDFVVTKVAPAEMKIIKPEPTENAKGKGPTVFITAPEILISVVQETKENQIRENFMPKMPAKEPPAPRDTVSLHPTQAKGERGAGTSYRNEFRPWTDVKPVKPIKAKSQYQPPEEKVVHETSYKATFKGESNQPTAGDNKLTERRRIRSLYSEPCKESSKVEKPSVQTSKPKKTSTSHKPVKKAKEKIIAPGRASKKKSAESTPTTKPEEKEKSKEINNKLAEAKENPAHPKNDTDPESYNPQ